jgi:hypothetical protein
MSDPNGWPDEAREVVASAFRAHQLLSGTPDGRPLTAERAMWASPMQFAEVALSALAPFVAARVAEAKREAAGIARRMFPHPTRDEYCDSCKDGYTHPGGDDLEAAILAAAEKQT